MLPILVTIIKQCYKSSELFFPYCFFYMKSRVKQPLNACLQLIHLLLATWITFNIGLQIRYKIQVFLRPTFWSLAVINTCGLVSVEKLTTSYILFSWYFLSMKSFQHFEIIKITAGNVVNQ